MGLYECFQCIAKNELGKLLSLEGDGGDVLCSVLVLAAAELQGIRDIRGVAILNLIEFEVLTGRFLIKVDLDLESFILLRIHVLNTDIVDLIGRCIPCFRCLILNCGYRLFALCFGQVLHIGISLFRQIEIILGGDDSSIVLRGNFLNTVSIRGDRVYRFISHADRQGFLFPGFLHHPEAPVVLCLGQVDHLGIRDADGFDVRHKGGNFFLRRDSQAADRFCQGDILRAGQIAGKLGYLFLIRLIRFRGFRAVFGFVGFFLIFFYIQIFFALGLFVLFLFVPSVFSAVFLSLCSFCRSAFCRVFLFLCFILFNIFFLSVRFPGSFRRSICFSFFLPVSVCLRNIFRCFIFRIAFSFVFFNRFYIFGDSEFDGTGSLLVQCGHCQQIGTVAVAAEYGLEGFVCFSLRNFGFVAYFIFNINLEGKGGFCIDLHLSVPAGNSDRIALPRLEGKHSFLADLQFKIGSRLLGRNGSFCRFVLLFRHIVFSRSALSTLSSRCIRFCRNICPVCLIRYSRGFRLGRSIIISRRICFHSRIRSRRFSIGRCIRLCRLIVLDV